MDEQNIFNQLREGSSEALSIVYKKFRGEFINWSVSTYSITKEDAKDIYQSCIIIFYENILTRKITVLNSSIKTYLFGIGKNKIRETMRTSSKVLYKAETPETDFVFNEVFEDEENEYYFDLFKTCLNELGNPCKDVLVYYYYRNFTMREIAQAFDYKNEGTAKNSKYKCLQRLKSCFFSKVEERKS